jgi:hypothetical protein
MAARPDSSGFCPDTKFVDGRYVASWAWSVVRDGREAIIRGSPKNFVTEAEAKELASEGGSAAPDCSNTREPRPAPSRCRPCRQRPEVELRTAGDG